MIAMSDILQVFGVIFLLKSSIKLLFSLIEALKTFVISKYIKTDFKTSYGEWALITGCTGGIGKAYSTALAERGLNIVLVSRSQEKLDALAREIEKTYNVLTKIIVIDFRRPENILEIKTFVEQNNIHIGVLVNNVGYLGEHSKPFLDASKSEVLDMININCMSASILCHDFLPAMKRAGKGAIINISSALSYAALPTMGVYCATKHFLSTLTKVLQLENQNSGVIIQDLTPGTVRTQMTQYQHDELNDSLNPPPETFVASALATLGHSKRTSGWYIHSLQILSMVAFPEWLSDRVFPAMLEKAYKKILEKKKQNE